MDFSDNDFKETEQVAEIIRFCDTAGIKVLEQVVDDIYRYQPFLISIFLGYKDDVTTSQHDEILRILIIIWLYFKEKQVVKQQAISLPLFEKKEQQNIHFLQYLEGDASWEAQQITTTLNLGLLQSKALFTAVLFKIKDGATLKQLDTNTAAIILLGMKSLIEAFEEIVLGY